MSNSEKSDLKSVKESTQMIICAIDSLKGRKARPDETKICHFVERRFGVKKEDIVIAIRQAVSDGSVLKVKYKDSVSYRNPLKFSQKMSNHIMSVSDKSCNSWSVNQPTMKRVLRVIRALCRSRVDSVSKLDIIDSLHSNCHYVNYSESLVDKVLSYALKTGSVIRLANGKYTLSDGKRIVARKGDADQTASSAKLFETESFEFNDNIKDNDDCDITEDSSMISNVAIIGSVSLTRKKSSPVMTRERPVSKRKKFKKSMGPDFIESSELGLQYMRDSFEPKCDLCHLRCKSNKRGEREELLSCKDCSAKAHPSCMEYSEELAERSSREPWQCMECKQCHICNDSKDGENMLVCDLCDKGFHMNCHFPVVKHKPIGKWECNQCIHNNNNLVEIKAIKTQTNPNIDRQIAQQIGRNEEKSELNDDLVDKSERINEKRNSETSSMSSFASNSKENFANSYPEVVPNPQKWSPEEVQSFIRNIGFPEQSLLFKEQEIDGTSLLLLRRSDVLTGFDMKLGPALKIYSHIMRLQKND